MADDYHVYPTEVLADFAEAIRRSNFEIFKGQPGAVKRLNFQITNIDTSAPCFYFNMSEFPTSSVTNTLLIKAANYIRRNKFHLPYDECFFLFFHVDNSFQFFILVHCVVHAAAKQIVMNLFVTDSVPYETIQSNQSWSFIPAFVGIVNKKDIGYLHPSLVNVSSSDATYQSLCKQILDYVRVTIMLLAEPKTYIQTPLLIGPLAKAVNSGRVKSKLKPLGKVVRINLGETKNTNPTYAIVSSPKRPHHVRGHYRTLPSGEQVPVKAYRTGKHKGLPNPRKPSYIIE